MRIWSVERTLNVPRGTFLCFKRIFEDSPEAKTSFKQKFFASPGRKRTSNRSCLFTQMQGRAKNKNLLLAQTQSLPSNENFLPAQEKFPRAADCRCLPKRNFCERRIAVAAVALGFATAQKACHLNLPLEVLFEPLFHARSVARERCGEENSHILFADYALHAPQKKSNVKNCPTFLLSLQVPLAPHHF